MSDRPIVFSTPMVQAILREIAAPGTGKTQTRRMIAQQPELLDKAPFGGWHVHNKHGGTYGVPEAEIAQHLKDYLTPPWAPGDRAWVREGLKRDVVDGHRITRYAADEKVADSVWDWKPKALAGRYMPRFLNRLTLHITDVRVMRLQDTAEADALAEGIVQRPIKGAPEGMVEYHIPGVEHPNKDFPYLSRPTAREMYAALMDTLHESGFWASNPWVYALTFVPELKHIDNARRAA